jgi:HSP20 family protein
MSNALSNTGETCVTRRERPRATFTPPVDILENDQELVIHADMPGLKPDDIQLQFENGLLTVEGNVVDRYGDGTRLLHSEYGVGDFQRQFRISEVIDPDAISADYADGVLTVRLPKVAAAQPRRIAVQGG